MHSFKQACRHVSKHITAEAIALLQYNRTHRPFPATLFLMWCRPGCKNYSDLKTTTNEQLGYLHNCYMQLEVFTSSSISSATSNCSAVRRPSCQIKFARERCTYRKFQYQFFVQIRSPHCPGGSLTHTHADTL